MNKKTPAHIKGDTLEDAVEMIYTQITKVHPPLSAAQLKIERKKLIFPGGVKREVDIYVSVDPGGGLESVFIFECKNWKKPVDANSITIFATKVAETNASKGFFVATAFSKDARREAEKYTRIELLEATSLPLQAGLFPAMHTLFRDPSKGVAKVEFFQKGFNKSKKRISVAIALDSSCIYKGNTMPIMKLIEQITEEMIGEFTATYPSHRLEEGVYNHEKRKEYTFVDQELLVNDKEMQGMEVQLNFELMIVKPRTKAQFSIEGKGVYLEEYYTLPTGEITIRSVRLEKTA